MIEPSGDPTQQPDPSQAPAAPQQPASGGSWLSTLAKGALVGLFSGLASSKGTTSFSGGLAAGAGGALQQQQQVKQNQLADDANSRANQDQQNQNQEAKNRSAQMQLQNRELSMKLHALDPHDPAYVQETISKLADQGDAGLKAGALLKTPEFKSAVEAEQYVHQNPLNNGNYQVRVSPYRNASGEVVYGGLEYDNSPSTADVKITYQGPEGKTATAVVPAGTPKNKIAELQVAAANQAVNAKFKEHDEKLKDQAASIDSNAQLLVSGKTAPSLIANRNGQRDKAIARAAELDPNFSAVQAESKFQSGKALDKAFTSGAEAKSITAFNTASDHLNQLDGLVDALGNGDVTALNKIGNDFAKATGSAAPTNFDAVRNAAVGEVTKVFAGAGVAQQERDEIAAPLKNSNSPTQLKQAISHLRGLMQSKKDALKNQYDSGKSGKPAFDGESKATKADPLGIR